MNFYGTGRTCSLELVSTLPENPGSKPIEALIMSQALRIRRDWPRIQVHLPLVSAQQPPVRATHALFIQQLASIACMLILNLHAPGFPARTTSNHTAAVSASTSRFGSFGSKSLQRVLNPGCLATWGYGCCEDAWAAHASASAFT